MFRTVAPEAGNVRLSIVERPTSSKCSRSEQDERSRRLDGMLETRVKDWMYLGLAPCTARYVKTDNLKEIRSGTHKHWRLMSDVLSALNTEYGLPKGFPFAIWLVNKNASHDACVAASKSPTGHNGTGSCSLLPAETSFQFLCDGVKWETVFKQSGWKTVTKLRCPSLTLYLFIYLFIYLFYNLHPERVTQYKTKNTVKQ